MSPYAIEILQKLIKECGNIAWAIGKVDDNYFCMVETSDIIKELDPRIEVAIDKVLIKLQRRIR